ncbi:MAG: PAS domain S-box protein, partial [Methanoregulaceae archaeon]|nr:PAS domain S-box protein [Methanoregulaceae archaeon]
MQERQGKAPTIGSVWKSTSRPAVRIGLLVVTLIFAFAINLSGLISGLSIFTLQLFYIPIVIACYWYPRKGVFFAVLIGILQLGFAAAYSYPELGSLTYAVTTASFYVLVALAVVVSSLSGDLAEKEARYHAIFDHSEAGVFLLSRDSGMKILEANRNGGAMLGYPPEELCGETMASFWPDADGLSAMLGKVRSGGSLTNLETRFDAREGGRVDVLASGAYIPYGQMVLTAVDITPRKRAEEQIKRRNRELSIINRIISVTNGSSALPDLMKGTFATLHDLFDFGSGRVYLFGSSSHKLQLVHRHGDVGPAQEEQDVAHYPYRTVIEGGTALFPTGKKEIESDPAHGYGAVIPLVCDTQVVGVMELHEGTHPLDGWEKTILESVGREIGCAIRKIRLNEGMAEANRRANLYLDILMHDINNANTASLGYADVLSESMEGRQKEVTGKLMESIQKSRDIIRNLETIRRLQEQPWELKAVRLDSVIREEIRHFPGVGIEYPGTDAMVYGDDLIGETFTNLLGNGVKYAGPEAHIRIEVKSL